jgi:hypothetical protein
LNSDEQQIDPPRHLRRGAREKVKSMMRRGSAPCSISQATRCASVAVLPEPGAGNDQERPGIGGRKAAIRRRGAAAD